ncbi:hypothetical protein HK100_012409 [Physocladia obscura]|uniref:Cyclic nucleotide-binding domain-containing protein n=1 Tax=Physocladia obscura TaxID=109957 RepID=A0AAD5T0E1_9FUNG|nr:hypothetical protein HK100_012409 [Physocladia obscura]
MIKRAKSKQHGNSLKSKPILAGSKNLVSQKYGCIIEQLFPNEKSDNEGKSDKKTNNGRQDISSIIAANRSYIETCRLASTIPSANGHAIRQVATRLVNVRQHWEVERYFREKLLLAASATFATNTTTGIYNDNEKEKILSQPSENQENLAPIIKLEGVHNCDNDDGNSCVSTQNGVSWNFGSGSNNINNSNSVGPVGRSLALSVFGFLIPTANDSTNTSVIPQNSGRSPMSNFSRNVCIRCTTSSATFNSISSSSFYDIGANDGDQENNEEIEPENPADDQDEETQGRQDQLLLAPLRNNKHNNTHYQLSRRESYLAMQRKSSFGNSSTAFADFGGDDPGYGKSPMFIRLRRIFRLVALASHFTKYLSKILKNPVQWGWEYDPDANFAAEEKAATHSSKGNYFVSAVDFTVGHLFSKNQFQGWLTGNMRQLFRKPPETRTELELSEMQTWCGGMKAFRKYPVNIQKELLRVGRYERWMSGRMIVGESQRGMYFYVILDGEIEMFKMDRDQMANDKRIASKRNSVDIINSSHGSLCESKKNDDYERKYRVNLGSQGSGESFGELAFGSEDLRLASAATKRTTEFLIITKEDYLRIVQDTNDQKLIEKLAVVEKIPIFSTLSGGLETIALYCEIKFYSPESVVISEGDICENIYFIRSGSCRLVKSIKFQKNDTKNKKHQRHSTSNYPATNSSQPAEHAKLPTTIVATKFLKIQDLFPGDFYFDGGDPSNQMISTAGLRTGAQSTMSLIANFRTEILVIPKIDFNKFATRETWRTFEKATGKILPPLNILSAVYVENQKWSFYKKQVVGHVLEKRGIKNNHNIET